MAEVFITNHKAGSGTKPASVFEHGGAVGGDMFVEQNARLDGAQQPRQGGLAGGTLSQCYAPHSPGAVEAISLIPRGLEPLPFPLRCRAVSGRERDMKAARSGKINEDSIIERTALGAIVQSGTVLGETAQRLFAEWADIGRARMERGFDRINAFLQCRTPQDFVTLQGELLHDNMDTVLGYARKAREHSARLADEAERRFGSLAEVLTSRLGEVGGHGQTTQSKPAHQTARRKSAHKRSAPVGGATARRRRPSR